jgi:hypothetical protein
MNELMWEIAEKAMDQGPGYHHYDPVFLAEYTKLIVQECISACATDRLGKTAGAEELIKEHFGVTE